ncbi:MAG: hypothetical protein HY905_20600 [Deltaproteobacteria bacterium]|nr:hypothetical protein [Deltaproteobacteria bacterium]
MRLPMALLLLALPAPAAADDLPPLEFVEPLTIEAGPVISPAPGVAPATYVRASLAAGGGTWSVGRADYTEVFGRFVAGGAWSPWFFPRLELGGDMVFLTEQSIRTVVPPAIDEWAHRWDLGELRVRVSALAWELDTEDHDMQLGVRPYVQLTLPTDTSRWSEGRRSSPLRRVLGDAIREHEFVLTDVGAAVAWRWRWVNAWQALGFVFGAIIDADFQFLLASTTGLGFDILDSGVEVLVELNYLGRLTEVGGGAGTMHALAVSPGVRWRTGDLTLGLEARVGLTGDSAAVWGDATGGVTFRYDF